MARRHRATSGRQPRRWLAGSVALVSLALFAPFVGSSPAIAGTLTTVTGKIQYTATDGSLHPVRDIDIAVMDADGTPNGDRVACGTTDDNGNYSVEHAAFVLAFTTDNEAHAVYPDGYNASTWAHDLPRLVKGPTV